MCRSKPTIIKHLAITALLFTTLPLLAATVIDVTKAGALGDGTTLNTASI